MHNTYVCMYCTYVHTYIQYVLYYIRHNFMLLFTLVGSGGHLRKRDGGRVGQEHLLQCRVSMNPLTALHPLSPANVTMNRPSTLHTSTASWK